MGAINSFAPIRRCTRSNVSVNEVLGIDGFDLQRTLARDPAFLSVTTPMTRHDQLVTSHSIDQGAARHLRGVKAGDLDLMLVQEWIGDLLQEHSDDICASRAVKLAAALQCTARCDGHSHGPMLDPRFEQTA